MSSWFNFDFFVCWMRTQPWNLNLYKQTKCSLAARSHIPTQNSNADWQVGLRNLKPLFTWQKILHRQFVTEKYYFRYASVFTWKKSRWSVLKILGAYFLGPGPGAGTPPTPLSTLMYMPVQVDCSTQRDFSIPGGQVTGKSFPWRDKTSWYPNYWFVSRNGHKKGHWQPRLFVSLLMTRYHVTEMWN